MGSDNALFAGSGGRTRARKSAYARARVMEGPQREIGTTPKGPKSPDSRVPGPLPDLRMAPTAPPPPPYLTCTSHQRGATGRSALRSTRAPSPRTQRFFAKRRYLLCEEYPNHLLPLISHACAYP